MIKTTQRYVTQGIQAYEEIDVATIFRVANKYHDTSYFLSFKPKENKTIVTDGNNNIFETLDIQVPEVLYCIRDDFDEYFTTTLLLSHEY